MWTKNRDGVGPELNKSPDPATLQHGLFYLRGGGRQLSALARNPILLPRLRPSSAPAG